MNQFEEFFRGLFSTSEWPPRWSCGYWSDLHGWVYIISELLIWVAYFLIPLIILNYLRRKKASLRFNSAYVYFAAFILLCGSTHFLDAIMFWVPMYRFNALIRLVTASVSLATVYHLVRILPGLFQQRTGLELEHEIGRRIAAEKQLETANESLQAFVYAASHDLQEPLRKVCTFTDRALERDGDRLSDASRVDLGKTQAAAGRMQNLIKDLLLLYSIRQDAPLEKINPAEPLQEALDILELAIKEKGANINLEPLPMISGAPSFLVHLFYNLVSNSLKFATQKPEINISGSVETNWVRITVADNGIGIPPEHRHKIFAPFQRLQTEKHIAGTGVGLSIVKKVMDLHKGLIEIDGEPGKGTRFHLFFKHPEA